MSVKYLACLLVVAQYAVGAPVESLEAFERPSSDWKTWLNTRRNLAGWSESGQTSTSQCTCHDEAVCTGSWPVCCPPLSACTGADGLTYCYNWNKHPGYCTVSTSAPPTPPTLAKPAAATPPTPAKPAPTTPPPTPATPPTVKPATTPAATKPPTTKPPKPPVPATPPTPGKPPVPNSSVYPQGGDAFRPNWRKNPESLSSTWSSPEQLQKLCVSLPNFASW